MIDFFMAIYFRKFFCHLLILGWVCLPTIVNATDPNQTNIGVTNSYILKKVGHYTKSTRARDVIVKGQYAYLLDWDGHISIIDVSDLSKPRSFEDSSLGAPICFRIEGNLLYESTLSKTIRVLDISNPYNLDEVSSYKFSNLVSRFCVKNRIAYVTTTEPELFVIDFTSMNKPKLLYELDTPLRIEMITLYGNYAFYTVNQGDFQDNDSPRILYIADISDPKDIKMVSTYQLTGCIWEITFKSNHAYLAAGKYGIYVLDIGKINAPRLINTISLGKYVYDIVLAGYFAYIADGSGGVKMIDIGNPLRPTLVANYETPGSARGLDIKGDIIFVANDTNGLLLLR